MSALFAVGSRGLFSMGSRPFREDVRARGVIVMVPIPEHDRPIIYDLSRHRGSFLRAVNLLYLFKMAKERNTKKDSSSGNCLEQSHLFCSVCGISVHIWYQRKLPSWWLYSWKEFVMDIIDGPLSHIKIKTLLYGCKKFALKKNTHLINQPDSW